MAQGSEQGPSCFVVMPFGEPWDRYYTQVYVKAIERAGLRPERSDEVFRAGSVLQEIVESLAHAAVVLVDITEGNRNVHYELGLAHALGRPTLLVAPRGMKLFFDIGQERMVTYDKDDAFWGEELQKTLVQALRETVAQPTTAIPTAFMHIKPTRMESDEVALRLRRIEDQLADLTRSILSRRVDVQSGFAEKIHSPIAAQEHAASLLKTMSPGEAIRELVIEGYKPAMAEDAVFKASRQLGKAF